MQMPKKKTKSKLDKKKCSEENVVNGEMKNALVTCPEAENKENVQLEKKKMYNWRIRAAMILTI